MFTPDIQKTAEFQNIALQKEDFDICVPVDIVNIVNM